MIRIIKKILKITGLVCLGFLVLMIILALILPTPPESESEPEEPKIDKSSKSNPKQMRFDWTCEEQGIVEGDWVAVQGYISGGFGSFESGSRVVSRGGSKRYGGWFNYSSGGGYFNLYSQERKGAFDYAPTDKISVQWFSPEDYDKKLKEEFNELCVIIARDLERDDLQYVELIGKIDYLGKGYDEKSDGTRQHLDTIQLKSESVKMRILTPEDVQESVKREHEELLDSVRADKRLVTDQFGWGGKHFGLTEWIKDRMNNPGSFKHVNTTNVDRGSHLIVTTTYRGTNLYGAVVTETIAAKVDMQGNILEVLEE